MTSLNCTSYLVTSAEVAKVCPDNWEVHLLTVDVHCYDKVNSFGMLPTARLWKVKVQVSLYKCVQLTLVVTHSWYQCWEGEHIQVGAHQLWWFLGIQSYPKMMGCSITSETHIVLWFHNHSQVSQDFLGDLKNREGSPILASPLPLILSDVKNHIKSNGSTSLAPLRLRVLLKHPFWRCYFVPGKDPVNPIELDAS